MVAFVNLGVGIHVHVAPRRFLGHIDAQIADESGLLPDVNKEFGEVDFHSHFPDAPESWAMHQFDVTYTDICTALTVPAGTDDAEPLLALFLAYNGNAAEQKAGIVDALALDAALPHFLNSAYLRFLPATGAKQVFVAHNECLHLQNAFGVSFARPSGEPASAPPRSESVVIEFVATADTLLTCSTVRTGSAAAPLVYLCNDNAEKAVKDESSCATATAAPGALDESPLSLPLGVISTNFPVLSILALHEPALGVPKDQLAYLLAEHDWLARAWHAV
ncbi:hypothetical protein H9P43_008769 [Blastocladiella emersonii ATCC 22665]|nr:hypothetical protein H9P43_008769 [Blastocladiella emersonii ATCC 22665]